MFKEIKHYTSFTTDELVDNVPLDGINITEKEMQLARANDGEMFLKIGKEYYYAKKDYKKALAWYYKAALQGNNEALRLVGRLYFYGSGVSQDYKQAMDWYLKSVNNGHTIAMNDIAFMYRFGYGVTKNMHTAIEWYTKAANQGDVLAQNNLGWVYMHQDGSKDLQKAANWYQKVADIGSREAEMALEYLNGLGFYAEEEQNNQDEEEVNGADQRTYEAKYDQLKNQLDNLQSQMLIMEKNHENDKESLKKEIFALQQNQVRQDEESRQLREELAKLKAILQSNASSDSIDNDTNCDTESRKRSRRE